HSVNDTAHAIPDTTLNALMENVMLAQPDAIAIIDGDRRLTYGELNVRTLHIAQTLHGVGVRRGDSVAVAMPRSLELTLALIGAMRAGAAYLPLDIQHPKERLHTLLRLAAPRAALVLSQTQALLPDDMIHAVV